MSRTQGKGKWAAGAAGPRREAQLSTYLDAVSTRADDGAQRCRAEEGLEVMWPHMPMMWDDALHNARGPTNRSVQRSALTPVNISKAGAHRA